MFLFKAAFWALECREPSLEGRRTDKAGLAERKITVLDPHRFENLRRRQPDLVVVDVRRPSEFHGDRRLPEAVNISVENREFIKKVLDYPRDKPLGLYCHDGSRSLQAAEILAGLEFQNIYVLKDGILGWGEAGLPLDE
jgi:rhodanese-related sulfurtransferase